MALRASLALPPQERRQAERARICIAVRKRIGSRAVLCQASNISTRGMVLAQVSEGVEIEGEKCWLEFTLPGSEVLIAARGQILRSRRHERYELAAVRFTSLAPSHRRMIERYLDLGPNTTLPSPFGVV
ncbi:MAG: PilZ domain-containing protein [Deltaproteobacteria bacterium]|nr:PilZ domain-containing protein [Deltaproteobacteria bacterium]